MIAIRPPAYFPPLGYTALLYHVDHFVLADTFRFRRQSFQNRSKLRNAQGTHWIQIPLFGRPDGAPFRDIEIETGGRWREKHWRSFLYDYRSTMYFSFYRERFQPFFEREWTTLGACTSRAVALQAELFGADTELSRASALEGAPTSVAGIVDALDADTLVVPASMPEPEEAPAAIQRFDYEHPTYHQNFEGFETGVSAMDLLFNYGREAPRLLMKGATVESSSVQA